MKKNSIFIAALCLAFCGKVSATFVQLTASRDAVVAFDAGIPAVATTNFGAVPYNSAWCDKSGQRGNFINRAIIDFNLASIPVGANILSATLYLYGVGPVGNFLGHTQSSPNGNDCFLERVTNNWQELLVDWNTQPLTTPANAVSVAGTNVLTQNYMLNVTALIQDYVNNPASSFGLMLRLQNESPVNALIFGSRENQNPDLQPRLEIEYTTWCYGSVDLVSDYDAPIGFHDGANTAGNNYGTGWQNAGYMVPSAAQSWGNNGNRALIHFDLSTLPANSIINSAALDLFAYGPVGSFPGHMQSSANGNASVLEIVTGPWAENTVTWNNQPGITPANAVNLAGTTNATLDYLGINVTTMMNAIYTSANNYGFMLKLQNEVSTNILIFCSEDHPTASKHPVLHLQYQYDCSQSGGGGGNGGKIAHTAASGQQVATINEFFSVYPNPSKGNFNLKYGLNDRAMGSVIIEDMQGRIIFEQNLDITNHSFEVKDIPKGVYFCKLITDGKVHSVEKVIITE